MSAVINVHEAKTRLSQILELVRAGEDIVLAKNGVPYARLVPIVETRQRTLGFVHAKIDDDFFEPLPDELASLWE